MIRLIVAASLVLTACQFAVCQSPIALTEADLRIVPLKQKVAMVASNPNSDAVIVADGESPSITILPITQLAGQAATPQVVPLDVVPTAIAIVQFGGKPELLIAANAENFDPTRIPSRRRRNAEPPATAGYLLRGDPSNGKIHSRIEIKGRPLTNLVVADDVPLVYGSLTGPVDLRSGVQVADPEFQAVRSLVVSNDGVLLAAQTRSLMTYHLVPDNNRHRSRRVNVSPPLPTDEVVDLTNVLPVGVQGRGFFSQGVLFDLSSEQAVKIPEAETVHFDSTGGPNIVTVEDDRLTIRSFPAAEVLATIPRTGPLADADSLRFHWNKKVRVLHVFADQTAVTIPLQRLKLPGELDPATAVKQVGRPASSQTTKPIHYSKVVLPITCNRVQLSEHGKLACCWSTTENSVSLVDVAQSKVLGSLADLQAPSIDVALTTDAVFVLDAKKVYRYDLESIAKGETSITPVATREHGGHAAFAILPVGPVGEQGVTATEVYLLADRYSSGSRFDAKTLEPLPPRLPSGSKSEFPQRVGKRLWFLENAIYEDPPSHPIAASALQANENFKRTTLRRLPWGATGEEKSKGGDFDNSRAMEVRVRSGGVIADAQGVPLLDRPLRVSGALREGLYGYELVAQVHPIAEYLRTPLQEIEFGDVHPKVQRVRGFRMKYGFDACDTMVAMVTGDELRTHALQVADSVDLPQPLMLGMSIPPTHATAKDLSISLSATGGKPPYQFTVDQEKLTDPVISFVVEPIAKELHAADITVADSQQQSLAELYAVYSGQKATGPVVQREYSVKVSDSVGTTRTFPFHTLIALLPDAFTELNVADAKKRSDQMASHTARTQKQVAESAQRVEDLKAKEAEKYKTKHPLGEPPSRFLFLLGVGLLSVLSVGTLIIAVLLKIVFWLDNRLFATSVEQPATSGKYVLMAASINLGTFLIAMFCSAVARLSMFYVLGIDHIVTLLSAGGYAAVLSIPIGLLVVLWIWYRQFSVPLIRITIALSITLVATAFGQIILLQM